MSYAFNQPIYPPARITHSHNTIPPSSIDHFSQHQTQDSCNASCMLQTVIQVKIFLHLDLTNGSFPITGIFKQQFLFIIYSEQSEILIGKIAWQDMYIVDSVNTAYNVDLRLMVFNDLFLFKILSYKLVLFHRSPQVNWHLLELEILAQLGLIFVAQVWNVMPLNPSGTDQICSKYHRNHGNRHHFLIMDNDVPAEQTSNLLSNKKSFVLLL